MRLYNTWISAQANLEITIVPFEQRAVVTQTTDDAETDDDIAYLAVKIVLSVWFTTVLRDGTVVTWDD